MSRIWQAASAGAPIRIRKGVRSSFSVTASRIPYWRHSPVAIAQVTGVSRPPSAVYTLNRLSPDSDLAHTETLTMLP